MAARYWVSGGNGNWDSTTNWSATSGGASGASYPTSSDDVFFDGNSGAGTSTINSAFSIQSLDCTGFTGTLTQGANLTVGQAGAYVLTLVSGMTFTPSTYKVSLGGAGAATLTTGGKSFYDLTISNGGGVTLGSALNVTNLLTMGAVDFSFSGAYDITTVGLTQQDVNITISGNITITGTFTPSTTNGKKFLGAFNINIQGDIAGAGYPCIGSGGTFIFNGSANQAVTAVAITGNVTINKSGGTLTFTGQAGQIIYGYSLGGTFTWTYTAGTVDMTTNTVLWVMGNGVNINNNLNTSGMTWYSITVDCPTALTLQSALDVNGNLVINASRTLDCATYQVNVAGNFTRNGTYTLGATQTTIFDGATATTIAGATTFYNLTIAAGKTVHLTSTQTFTVSNTFTASGTLGNVITLDATTGGSQANLNVTNGVSWANRLNYINATDINSSSGGIIYCEGSTVTLSNTNNWITYISATVQPSIIIISSLLNSPTVQIINNITIQPEAIIISNLLNSHQGIPINNISVSLTIINISAIIQQPTVSIMNNIIVQPSVIEIISLLNSPVVTPINNITIQPEAIILSSLLNAPQVIIINNIIVVSTIIILSSLINAPTVYISNSYTFEASLLVLKSLLNSPTVSIISGIKDVILSLSQISKLINEPSKIEKTILDESPIH